MQVTVTREGYKGWDSYVARDKSGSVIAHVKTAELSCEVVSATELLAKMFRPEFVKWVKPADKGWIAEIIAAETIGPMTWDIAHRLISKRGLTPIASEYESPELQELCEALRKHLQAVATIQAKIKQRAMGYGTT
jgi:hypothetical protein